MCGNAQLAEELAQEAFTRALNRWNVVSGLDRPAGWLYRTGFNLVRREWKRPLQAVVTVDLPAKDDGVANVENRLTVEQMLERLTLPQRKAVVLRHVLGHSTESAAAILGIEPDALRAVLHRAMVSLRAEYTAEYEGWPE